MKLNTKTITNGVMLNLYPDSIGQTLSDTVKMLEKPEFKNVFSLLYLLPTFFNSDLDRGFSIIDYDINKELVDVNDLDSLRKLGIKLKFDIVLNHLSVASPQFKSLLKEGKDSKYKDFFINWNEFWDGNGVENEEGIVIPREEFLNKLFMRKSGLPVLMVRFPDGSEQPYWNTFYQQVTNTKIKVDDLSSLTEVSTDQKLLICELINKVVSNNEDIGSIDFGKHAAYKDQVLDIIKQNRTYLGQMDVNGESPLVWEFYEETLKKLSGYGCDILRLDAFAYLHKQVGETNFFNNPGTWHYLERIKKIADSNGLLLLPEIHAEYGLHLHDQVADKGYTIYDFFLPGLAIHTIENKSSKALLKWAKEIVEKGYQTVNMLGCHDGIPILDLKGKIVEGVLQEGLLGDSEIEAIMNTVINRGGRVKNLYDPSGKKISYYQVNATFYSALGEDDQKMLLARAIQMFMPGIPQVWYLDLFAGKNNYEAADNGGSAGHKEINRTTLSMLDIEQGLNRKVVARQLELIHLRNTSTAFSGLVEINTEFDNKIDIKWTNNKSVAQLCVDLTTYAFFIEYTEDDVLKKMTF